MSVIGLIARALGLAREAGGPDDWLVIRSATDKPVSILCVRATLPNEVVRRKFPIEASLSIAFEASESGMPDYEGDLVALDGFEEVLRARDPNQQLFLQAIRSTGNGKREWTFYVTSEISFLQLLGDEPVVDRIFRLDPEWSRLRDILSRTKG